jgi:hypothetical protein
MKVTVSPSEFARTSRPLRLATGAARDIRRGTTSLVGHGDYTGHDELGTAVADFLQSWGQTLEAVAAHGESLARMLDLAGSAYTDSDDRARRHHLGSSGDLT